MPYVGRDPRRGNYLKLDDIQSSFNGSTKTFNLTSGGTAYYPDSTLSVLVSVGGTVLEPATDYGITNNQITFTNAPLAAYNFFAIVQSTAVNIGVPGDAVVTGEKLSKPLWYDEYFKLDSNNNRVGIGLENPQKLLDLYQSSGNTTIGVKAAGGNDANIELVETGGTAIDFGETGSAGFKISYHGGDNKFYLTSGSDTTVNNRLTILRDTGDIGIGTDTPNGRLDVTKDSGTDYSATTDQRSSAQIIARNNTAGTNNFASISLVNGGGTQAEASINLIETDDYLGDIAFKSRTGGSTWSEKLRIDSTGRLLVGTTAGWGSSVKLHLASTGNTYAVITAGTSGNSVLAFSDDGTERGSIDYDHDGDKMLFKTAAGERLRITSEGYLKLAGTISGSNNKLGRFLMPSHDSSEQDVMYMQFQQEDTFNQLEFGGGSSSYNAATKIIFRTAAVDTVTGVERLQIDSSGNVYVGGVGASATAGSLWLNDTSANASKIWQDNGNSALVFGTGSGQGERLRITSTGQVRIDGTTSANHGLRFTPGGWNSYDNRMGYCGTSGADFWWSSNWNPTDGSRDHSGYATNFIRQNIDTGYLSFGTGGADVSAVERLRIDSSGRLITGGNVTPYPTRTATFQPVSGQTNTYISIIGGSTSSVSGITFGDAAGSDAGNYAGMLEYYNADDRLTYAQNASAKVTIDSAGKVGIGVTNPTKNFDVRGTGYQGILVGSTNNQGAQLVIDGIGGGDAAGGNYSALEVPTSGHLTIRNFDTDKDIILGTGSQTGANDTVVITDTQKVGIGTDEPFSNLTVYAENRSGGGSVTGQITAKDNAAWNASPTGGIIFQGHYHSNGANAIFGGVTGFKESTAEGNYAGALAFHTRKDGEVSGERLRIDSTGRLIVGASTDTIVNAFKVAIKETSSENAAMVFLDTDNMKGGICGIAKGSDELITGTTNVDFIVGSSYADTHIITGNGSNATGYIRATFDTSGRVLIGTTSGSQGQLNIKNANDFSTASVSTNTDNIYLISDSTSGNNVYGASIGFSRVGYADRRAAAIAAVQEGSDEDKVGLTFFTHPGADATDPVVEKLRISHDGRLLLGTQRTYGSASYYDDITINNSDGSGQSGGTGITLVSSTNSWASIYLGDGDNHGIGAIKYDHNTDSMRFVVNGTDPAVLIDSSNRVMIGTSDPGYAGYGDGLTVYKNNHNGITIRTPDDKWGALWFADSTSGDGRYIGGVDYSHPDDFMRLLTGGTERIRIQGTGTICQLKLYNYANTDASATCEIQANHDIRDSSKIVFGRENADDWSASHNAQYSFLSFHTRAGTGGLKEKVRINSSGVLQIQDSFDATQGSSQLLVRKGAGAGAAPETITRYNSYMHLGGTEWGSNAVGAYTISFGYTNGTTGTNVPAYIGFQETTTSSYTMGDLIFGVKGGTSDTAATEKVRIKSGGEVQSKLGGFVSYNKSDINVSHDTHGWSQNGWETVINSNALGDSASTYLINFHWSHEGFGAPWIVRGNFLWTPTGANHTGAVGASFVPVQCGHSFHGPNRTFQFQGVAAGNVRAGLQARALNWDPSNSNSQGILYVRATRIADDWV